MIFRQRSDSAAALLICTLLALFSCAMFSACTKNQRVDTLRASVQSLDVAAQGYEAWDLAHQQAIVSESPSAEVANTRIRAYRDDQDKIKLGFEVAYRLIALAATRNDEASYKEALRQVEAIIGTVTKLANGGGT